MFQYSKYVRILFYVNIAAFILSIILFRCGVDITSLFALNSFQSGNFQIHQLITHMFMHGGFLHLLLNMFALASIGPSVENRLGGRKFLLYYFISGLSGAILHSIMNPNPVVGASGAIFGVLVLFGLLFPEQKLIIFPIFIPIKAKYIVLFTVSLEIVLGFTSNSDGIAHFAHIGGAIAGFILYVCDKSTSKFKQFNYNG